MDFPGVPLCTPNQSQSREKWSIQENKKTKAKKKKTQKTKPSGEKKIHIHNQHRIEPRPTSCKSFQVFLDVDYKLQVTPLNLQQTHSMVAEKGGGGRILHSFLLVIVWFDSDWARRDGEILGGTRRYILWPCWPRATEEQSNIKEIYCLPWSLNKNICIVAEVTKYPQQERCYFSYLSGKSFLKRCNVSKIDLRSEIYHRCENYKVILLLVVKSKRQHFIINFVASFK